MKDFVASINRLSLVKINTSTFFIRKQLGKRFWINGLTVVFQNNVLVRAAIIIQQKFKYSLFIIYTILSIS